MRKLILISYAVLACSTFSFAQEEEYRIRRRMSFLTFQVRARIHTVHGKTNFVSGTIYADPTDIGATKIQVTLDSTSLDTGDRRRDKIMRNKSLEVEKYSEITFVSTAVESAEREVKPNQPHPAIVKGILNLHGLEKEITVPVTVVWDGERIVTEGDFGITLEEYRIVRPRILFFRVENDVKIHFKIGAEKAGLIE